MKPITAGQFAIFNAVARHHHHKATESNKERQEVQDELAKLRADVEKAKTRRKQKP